MGKRKTKRKPAPKRKLVLDTQFYCVYCSHEKSVEVKMDKKNRTGNLSCRICGISYQAPIHSLSDAIDVYYEWVDASESRSSAQAPNTTAQRPHPISNLPESSSSSHLRADGSNDAYDDDDLDALATPGHGVRYLQEEGDEFDLPPMGSASAYDEARHAALFGSGDDEDDDEGLL